MQLELVSKQHLDMLKCHLWSWCPSAKVAGSITCDDLARFTCDRWLTDAILEHVCDLLNQQCNNIAFFVLSEANKMTLPTLIHTTVTIKKETLQKIVAILNVRIDRETESSAVTCSLIPTGNHWVVFVIDMSTGTSYYADPLGYPMPYNLKIELDPFLQHLNKTINREIDYPIQLMHKVNFDVTGRHLCLGECLTYPSQTCSSMCGFVTIMTSAIIANCDERVWKCILLKRRIVNPLKQWLGIYLRPSEYPVIIHQALATWIVSGKITVANITDKRLNIPTEITMMLQTSQKATAAQIKQIGVFKIAKTAHLLHRLLPASPNNQKRVHFSEEPASCMQKQPVETKISTSSTLTQTKVQLSVTPSSQSV